MSPTRVLFSTAAVLIGPAIAFAQPKPLPVRPLGATEHTSKELLGAVSTTRALSDGRVLVNDIIGRRVLLFDPSLATYTVVADTTSATANAYSSRFGGLIAYRGDSSLFVDPQSLSMLVIDPAGKVTRVMSIPRPNDAGSLIGGQGGVPGFDAQGRLVYRASPNMRMARDAAAANGRSAGPMMPEFPDSAALVRVELPTRKLDTLAHLKIPRQRMSMTTDSAGRVRVAPIINPLQVVDEWAVMSDGSVAIVRGRDYHVDWVRADGSRASTGKVAFDWRHLDDSAKVLFMDSTKAAMEKVRAQANAGVPAGGGNMPIIAAPGAGIEAMRGMEIMVFRGEGERRAPGGDAGGAARGRPEGGGQPANFTLPPMQFVDPSELPDYAPPFVGGAARADMDGNLWVRTTNVVNGGAVYDIINGEGELLDRVLLPAGRVIAGFGPRGVVFMGVREAAGVRLEQARRHPVALPN